MTARWAVRAATDRGAKQSRNQDSALRRRDENRIPVPQPRKKQIAKAICFFQLYSPAASCMHFVRDIAFGSDMRFAR